MNPANRKSAIRLFLSVSLLTLTLGATAFADSITYTGTNGSLSANAIFSLSGNALTVTLTNTSSADVLVPVDVLTGLFFNTSHQLVPISASDASSTIYYGAMGNAGDGWGYARGLNAQGMNSAISASGAVTGLGHSNFSSTHTNLGGLNYGLLSAGDDPLTGNTGVKGHGPLIKDSVEFVFSVGDGFTLTELGNEVLLQYGTSLNEPHYLGERSSTATPEPTSLLLIGSGLLGVWSYRKRLV